MPEVIEPARSWIEVVDSGDGPGRGTGRQVAVYLVMETDAGPTRFRLPNVVSVDYHADDKSNPVLTLGIGHAHVQAHVAIAPGRSTVEDLLSEIAAARIREAKES